MLTVKTNQNFLQLNINMISYNGSEGFSESPAKRLVIRNHVHQFVRAYCVTLVMSNTFRPCGLQPARLLSPQDSLGKNIGVGYHALLQGIFLTQGSNPGLLNLLHCHVYFFTPSASGNPNKILSKRYIQISKFLDSTDKLNTVLSSEIIKITSGIEGKEMRVIFIAQKGCHTP